MGKFGFGSESGFWSMGVVCALLELDAEICSLELDCGICELDSASLLDETATSFEEPAVATELEDAEALLLEELDSEPAVGVFAEGVLGLESLHAVNAKDIAAIAVNENPQLLKCIFPPIYSIY